jgi:hypothetical protein
VVVAIHQNVSLDHHGVTEHAFDGVPIAVDVRADGVDDDTFAAVRPRRLFGLVRPGDSHRRSRGIEGTYIPRFTKGVFNPVV